MPRLCLTPGNPAILLPLSVWLFEPTVKSRRRMLPFLFVGIGTALYILWALTAFSFEVYIRLERPRVCQSGDKQCMGCCVLIATCGSLFFSRIRDMVVFGAANLVTLLVVMAVKRYAFTSLWCAYAALSRVIILAYFWKSIGRRPFQYAEAAMERL